MKNSEHAFDPFLISLYTQKFKDTAVQNENDAINSRHFFYQLNQSGNDQQLMPKAYDFLMQGLRHAEFINSSFFIKDYDVKKLADIKAASTESLPEHLLTSNNELECVKQTSAILLTQPCWLQNISMAASSQTAIAVQMMSIYIQLTGKDQGGSDLQEMHRSLLLATGTGIPSLHSVSYSQQAEIIPEMLGLACIQLAFARFPRVFFPEILGFSLAYCQMPSLIEICFPNHQLPSLFFETRKQRLDEQISPLVECITDYLDCFPQHKRALWLRIQNGFCLYQQQIQDCRERFLLSVEKPISPHQAIARLFQKKAMAAIGHHQKIQLQGVSLDHWFAGMPTNNLEFLQALKQSGFVNREKPLESPLLALFDIKGPMFGVVNKSELEIIKNWLQEGLNETPVSITQDSEKIEPYILPSLRFQPTKNYEKLSNRELYYYLVNADLFPDVMPVARAKASKWLRLCTFFNSPPFINYSHKHFDAYIKTIYQREMSAYQPLQGKPKTSREAYVWGLEQLAPMILIDGCWIQHSLDLQNVNSEISEILFSIYCDEVGNGQLEKNHPYIFHQLLNSLSIDLPPVYSEDFVKYQRFINSAFDLPVYMLALSSFSVEFLPELLGLNMAIELSGLGRGYMGLVDEWNYWGIDPAIAKVHISIDNYASGHTFLAKKAIQLYMDDILQCTGDREVLDRHWRRIYSGYASLRFVGTRFRLGLPISYLINKFRYKDVS